MKKKSLLTLMLVIAIAGAVSLSCNKDPDPKNTLQVTPSEAITFEASGNSSVTLTVTTNAASWDVSHPNWVIANTDKGNNTITVNVTDNTAGQQSDKLTVTAGTADPVEITITQKEYEAPLTDVNLAIGGTATASSAIDDDGLKPASNLIDGNSATYWASSRLSSADNNVWAQIQLVQKQPVNQIWIYPRAASPDLFPAVFTLQVSEEGTNWTTVYTEDGVAATNDNPKKYAFEPITAAYIKLDVTRLGMANPSTFTVDLGEIEVYLTDNALPADPGEQKEVNVAAGGYAFASSTYTEGSYWLNRNPARLIDGVIATDDWWGPVRNTVPACDEYAVIKLVRKQNINQIKMYSPEFCPVDFEFFTSTDGVNWGTAVVSKTNFVSAGANKANAFWFDQTEARYVKLHITKLATASAEVNLVRVGEIEIYLTDEEEPEEDPPLYNTNIALGGDRVWVSHNDWMGGFADANLTDGNTGTTWTSNRSTTTPDVPPASPEGFTIKLSQKQNINKVVLWPESTNVGLFPVDFTIQVSEDNSAWSVVADKTSYAAGSFVAQEFTFLDTKAEYVKVNITKHASASASLFLSRISEIEVYLTQ